MSDEGSRVPLVWVVASHRELTAPSGHQQQYTTVDQAGQRTLLNMGVQPVCYPRVPMARLAGSHAGFHKHGISGIRWAPYQESLHPDVVAFAAAGDPEWSWHAACVRPVIA